MTRSSKLTKAYAYAAFEGLPYRVFRAETTRPRPLIVFLHGVAERGDDNELQLSYAFFEEPRSLFGSHLHDGCAAHVIAPQAPESDVWVDVPSWKALETTMHPEPTPAMATLLRLVEELADDPGIDAQRIYLTGLSMGGFGVYDALARKPHLFAAGVPIAGGGDLAVAPTLAAIPLRIYHGALDPLVAVARSRDMVQALRAAGGTPGYVEYPDLGHNAWDAAYTDTAMIEWLFTQRR